ncbi:hypothetical protein Poli38472_002680 [Pythium oligandrum]|uniref:protein-serine/threonine phosphatase n=1 Tax=Pythium oligandrum TaxID=41045 RepID=A0A8K1CIL7_PYTOL|nr:hypothetical protein Poli38472_002680 [Pythium oligandrum]|eukprot:TMW63739.1 hypothetical protein Poli38472_002680 [Pythium oligandrum]
MMPVSRSKSQNANASTLKSETQQQKSGGLFQTVVFSRKNTNHGPNADLATGSPAKKSLGDLQVNPLASVVHQADRNGRQNAIVANGRTSQTRRLTREEGEGGSFRNLFANIWSALGISEQQQQAQAQKNSTTKPGTAPAGKPNASRNVVELRKSVIPPLAPQDAGKKCLVLDLDETLVHSSFKPTQNPDYIIPVDIDGTIHQVYVCKRPGVDEFLVDMAKHYEIVVYTASLSKYADPLLDQLDPHNVIRYRLFREHCVQYEGNYVKDLSLLDRDITQTIIIDNSPMSYLFHPRNAIGCSSFIDDLNDRELDSISRFLAKIRSAEDVRSELHTWDATY